MDVKCSICNSRALSHSRISKCAICYNVYHLKCLSLNAIDQIYILKNQATWFCTKCLSSVLPFNCIDNDTDFHQALNYSDHFELDWSSFCQKVFNPFETYNQLDLIFFMKLILTFTMSFIISMEFYLIIFPSISLTKQLTFISKFLSHSHCVISTLEVPVAIIP